MLVKLLLVLIALNTSLLSIQVSVERASGFSSDSSKQRVLSTITFKLK